MTRTGGGLLLAIALVAALSSVQASCQKRQVTPAPQAGAHAASKHQPTYHALVIGIANYQHLPQLRTPINDAKEIASVLRDQYRFNTTLLLDPTRRQILDALDHYRAVLQEDDNLFLYYAGHGFFDAPADLAYWAPADAESNSHDDWIIANEVTGVVRAIAARHVLIVSDSCYSGMLTRDAGVHVRPPVNAPSARDAFLAKLLRGKSRYVISSGGNEPVADIDASAASSNHSVFANALLRGLRQFNMKGFSADELFTQVRARVGERSNQLPGYSPIRDSVTGAYEDGEFVFFRSGKVPSGVQNAGKSTPQIPTPDNTATDGGENTDAGGPTSPANLPNDRESILRTFRTMFVQTSEARFFGSDELTAALTNDKDFSALNVQVVNSREAADVVLNVTYSFPWDYPFSLTHQTTKVVLLAGKGIGPFSGSLGAESVAKELIKLAKPYRTPAASNNN